ncbi:MAG: replicative DNA helicase [SAR202 cluster bacterium Casp-Chloro-G4]|nr:replicative DNA helicase [Chloroflexota bacterium]PKB61245.1 MAG: replicative DNA helicase [SAR202 cluster bacterium Casp-Chloro-G4]
MYAERLPPHDLNAEESVVGSILIDGDALPGVTSFLKSSDFFGERNRHCFEAASSLSERGEAINQVTVAHELFLNDHLENVGGSGYLSHLVMVVPTSVHIEHYARIVQRMSIMRQLIDVGGRIAGIGYDGGPDSDVAMSRAEELLFAVRSGRGAGDFTHIRDVLDEYLEESTAMHGPDSDHQAPVTTGYQMMDRLLGGGMQRSDMIVLAARPSQGKSTLAFNIARNAAGGGNSVGVFSLEMSRQQIGMRLLSSEADVDSYRMRLGLLNSNEETRLLDAVGMLSDMPIYIDDTPIQTIVEMRGKARRLQAERGLDLLVIDYLQLIGGTGKIDNRVQEMGEISRSIKGMARDLNIPVIACSQLSRAIEQRPNHRPLLSDLRESGSIEQDADIVSFIHREDAFISREDWDKREPTKPYPENTAEIIFAKHRNGPVGSVALYFRNDVVRFESLETTPSMEYA